MFETEFANNPLKISWNLSLNQQVLNPMRLR